MSDREYDDNGFYEIKANPLSKVGVFDYLGSEIGAPDPDKVYKVFRPAEELSSQSCLDSFKLIPIVNDHTMIGDKGVPAEKKGMHGVIGQDVHFKDGYLLGNIKVYSDHMSHLIDSGKNELSLGYGCSYDFTSGTFDGEYYDAIQKDIRGNHLALVDEGRMGKEVAVLDHSTITFDTKDFIMKHGPKSNVKAVGQDEEVKKDDESMDDEKKSMDEETKAMVRDSMKEAMKDMLPEMMKDMMTSMKAEAADEEAKEDEAEDEDPKKGMDALRGELKEARAEIAALTKVQAAAMDDSSVIKSISDRDALAAKVQVHVGTFDHSAMTITDVAKYGIDKLGIKCDEGHEKYALDAALQVMPKVKLVSHSAMDSSDFDIHDIMGGAK